MRLRRTVSDKVKIILQGGGVIRNPYPYGMLNCNNFGPTELVVHAITKVYHTKPSTWKTFYLLRLEKIIDLNSDGEMAAF